jgi:hypothetical protein
MPRPALEVPPIFRRHGPDYREYHRLSPVHPKALRAIERCRTARLGGHVDVCSQGCGYLAISYNSCRNRHCPKCQSLKQAKWLAERLERLLPTHSLHLVVTGGGLSADGQGWIAARHSLLLPVRALSKIIRAKFLEGLEKAFREERLKGMLPCLADPAHFPRFTRKLRRKKWLVYAKESLDA